LPQSVQLSQQLKVWTESSTPRDSLSPKPTNSPLKKEPYTHQQIMIMEGGDEDMEVDITM